MPLDRLEKISAPRQGALELKINSCAPSGRYILFYPLQGYRTFGAQPLATFFLHLRCRGLHLRCRGAEDVIYNASSWLLSASISSASEMGSYILFVIEINAIISKDLVLDVKARLHIHH